MTTGEQERRRQADEIRARLAAAYGAPRRPVRSDPVAVLVGTILSQNTSDTNSGLAFERLRERFAGWPEVRDADPEAVIEAIRPAGLARIKGPRIQNALRVITAQQGSLTLDFLADWPVERAKAWLQNIHGVGPKTAAIVLLFAMDRPAFPVDTHVHRVTRRLGLIGAISREQAHAALEALVPPEDYYSFHLDLIRHGRQVCVSRRPRCEACFLTDVCRYYQERHGPAG